MSHSVALEPVKDFGLVLEMAGITAAKGRVVHSAAPPEQVREVGGAPPHGAATIRIKLN